MKKVLSKSKIKRRKKKSPETQIFYELLAIEDKEFTVQNILGKINNNCLSDIRKYCNYFVKIGLLKLDNERWLLKKDSKKLINPNFYSINWYKCSEILIKNMVVDYFIEPDKELIKSVEQILKSKEGICSYKKSKEICPSQEFFKQLFDIELLRRKNISSKLKKAIRLLNKYKKDNEDFANELREKHCKSSKISKDYFIEPFVIK